MVLNLSLTGYVSIPVDAYARLSAECSVEGLERSIIKVVCYIYIYIYVCQLNIRLTYSSLYFQILLSFYELLKMEDFYDTVIQRLLTTIYFEF